MAEFKPNTIIPIPIPRDQFVHAWLTFMKPFHNLTNREMGVAVELIKKYLQLCKDIPDNVEFRNKCLLSIETQKEICKKCKLSNSQMQIYKAKLRESNFLIDGNCINPKLIPSLDVLNGDNYQLLVLFKLIDQEEQNNEFTGDNTDSIVEE